MAFVPSQRRSKQAIIVATISRLPAQSLNPTYRFWNLIPVVIPIQHRGQLVPGCWIAAHSPATQQPGVVPNLILTPQTCPHRAGPSRWCSDPSKRKSFGDRPAESRHAPATVSLFCQVPRLHLWTNRDWEGEREAIGFFTSTIFVEPTSVATRCSYLVSPSLDWSATLSGGTQITRRVSARISPHPASSSEPQTVDRMTVSACSSPHAGQGPCRV